MIASVRAEDIARRVVAWQKRHGRHDLPWQNTRDAYRIWLSEVMLQQTQVTTVVPYYHRFLERFPELAAMARAPLDHVLELWSGLGYYSRARNLHLTAQTVIARHGGRFPRDFDAVLALPGIGQSTAAAICVFAHGDRHAILDGNVKRLFARYFGIAGYPGDAKVQSQLWERAERALPTKDVEAYTQGLMDLGATVCVRGKPRCDDCPLNQDCVAHEQGRTAELPSPRPRKAVPQRHTRMLVLLHAGEVLLEKRVASGIWGGLWSLPEIAADADIRELCVRRYGVKAGAHEALPRIAHGFTHFKLDIDPLRIKVEKVMPRAAAPGPPHLRWGGRCIQTSTLAVHWRG